MRRSVAHLSLLLALCLAGCTSAEEPKLNEPTSTASDDRAAAGMIAGLRPLMYAAPLQAGERAAEAERLTRWLQQYLKGEYRIASQRLFAVEAERMHWMSIVKFVGNEVEQPLGGCVEEQPWQSPGLDLAAVWRFPDAPYKRIAVATVRDEDRSIDPVVGVFELERIDSARNENNLSEETAPCAAPGSLPPG